MRYSVRMAIVLTLLAVVGFLGSPALGDVTPYYSSYPSEYINKKGWLVPKPPLDLNSYRRKLYSYKDEWLTPYTSDDEFVMAKIGDKWGYVRNKFNVNRYKENPIKIQFDQAFKFYNGFAPVKINEKWGYIDKTGKFIIKPQFTWVGTANCNDAISKCYDPGYFHEGLAAVAADNYKFGFIDKTGKFVIKPQFNEVSPFSEGLAAVCMYNKSGQKCGYIDKTGKIIIKLQYDYASQFVNGIAEVKRNPIFQPFIWFITIIVVWAIIAIRKARRK